MRLPDNKDKYTAQFKYFEFAYYTEKSAKTGKPAVLRYVTDSNSKGSPPLLYTLDEIYEIGHKKYNNTGVYYTIFQYAGKEWDEKLARLGSLYFDLDHKEDINISYEDANKIYRYVRQFVPGEVITVYFSGAKGFHIEVEAIALGVSVSENLPEVYKFIAHDLEKKLDLKTMDYKVYDYRRIWRLPNTKHQATGLYKVNCTELISNGESLEAIQEYAKQPHDIDIPEQQLDVLAHRWYRDYVYDYEETLIHKAPTADMIARFLEHGSSNVKTFGNHEKVFDIIRLKRNCPSISLLEKKAKENHHLEHYDRLFLCSILTYTPEAIQYLHEILSQCSDYQFEVSNSHIEDWVSRRDRGIGGRPFSCDKAKSVGIYCSGCDGMDAKKKVIKMPDGSYVETGEYSAPSPIRWAYSNKKDYISF